MRVRHARDVQLPVTAELRTPRYALGRLTEGYMVTCSGKDYQGLDGLEVEIDIGAGLEPPDIDYVKGFLSNGGAFKNKVVPVHIYGPSTTDRALLDELTKAIEERVRELGREPAWNVHI
jgi:hypothetical protein